MGVQFTESAARRIVAATRRVEAMPGAGPTPQAAGPQPNETAFWARITATSATGKTYSWTRAIPDAAQASGFADDSPAVTGANNAREINAKPNIAIDTIVRLAFIGYDGSGNPVYAFAHGGGDSLPTPNAQHEVLQCTSYTNPTTYTLAFGWVRAHA